MSEPKPKPTKPSVTFIVFAYNEEAHIEATVETVLKAVALSDLADYQIVLANDGSTDSTGAIMTRIASQNSRICAVHNETNLGQGGAYKSGLKVARCEYVMGVAGDNAASVDSIRSTIEPVGKADIILPYECNPKSRRFVRRVGSRCFTGVINLLFRLNVRYYNGAVPRRNLLNMITIDGNGYAFFTEIVVKMIKKGCSHAEVGVRYPPSVNDHTSALRIKNLAVLLKDITRLFFDVRKSQAVRSKESFDQSV